MSILLGHLHGFIRLQCNFVRIGKFNKTKSVEVVLVFIFSTIDWFSLLKKYKLEIRENGLTLA